MAHQSVKEYLSAIKASEIPASKPKVITISSTETPYQGFLKLVENSILSAPVYLEDTKQFTGFLDMRDLVSFVIYIDDDQNSPAPNNLEDIVLSGLKLYKAPVDGVTVTYLSRTKPFHPIKETDSLWDAFELLGKGVHRVPVVNEKGEITNILSQSSAIQFLSKNVTHLGSCVTKSLEEIEIGTTPVVAVTHLDTAADAFRLMEKRKMSGLAVIDTQDGRLIGNTSSSDLKLFIKTPSIEMLKQPITDFLKGIRNENEIDIHAPVMAIESHDKLAFLIHKLASTKVHKLFVANDKDGFKPIKVISISDVLRFVMKH
eukprot:TRINITY_DN798_c0_g1_i1.p1 TRINITY_DN798_c0_g1~~TRINITY_DN798_c0_g1_i1.p1  ORF type:complete len:316 (+),score=95.22 TRINITY_DN798_c0_g1_i1:141-1088(+)